MVRSTDAVMIQYTSGPQQASPKGALLHHRGLVNNGAHTADRAGIPDGAVQVTTMPLFHTGGCVCCVIGAVAKRAHSGAGRGLRSRAGDRTHGDLSLQRDAGRADDAGSDDGASVVLPQADLSSLKAIYSGGSTVPAAIVADLERRLGAPSRSCSARPSARRSP